MPDFEVWDKHNVLSKQIPVVTILKSRLLSLNLAAFVALDQPAAVELLFDRTKRVVGLRAIAPSAGHACFVRPSGRSRKGPFLVSAMAFLEHYRIDSHESRRWQAWLEDDTLCVSLDDESESVTARHP